jgi:DNA repair exonuclease SbcCD ATPase subunit
MHKQRAKQEDSFDQDDRGGKNLVESSGSDSSEWSKAGPEAPEEESQGNSFGEKVEEARQQIKDVKGSQGKDLQQQERENSQPGSQAALGQDQRRERQPDTEESQRPASTRDAMEEVKKIAKGEKDSRETEEEKGAEEEQEEDKTDTTEGQEDTGEEQEKGNLDQERYEELEERLERIEERLDEKEESEDSASEEESSDLESRTSELESHMPSWDELGSLEEREDDSLLVKADLDALDLESGSQEMDEDVLDRIDELEQRIEKVGDLEDKADRIDTLSEKVDDLEGELRGEEIEIRNRLGDLEDEIEGLRNKINASSEDAGDIHGQAMHEEMQELREDVKELSNAVVQISKKVYDQK